ncbi:hypothetical protein, partial [Morganella morganii]|uniref:hypothetical protein n=1 Tax=Morganella morganii TaxID=582 RepID=UPI001FFD78B8
MPFTTALPTSLPLRRIITFSVPVSAAVTEPFRVGVRSLVDSPFFTVPVHGSWSSVMLRICVPWDA